ncbi:MAG: amidohydrolase [Chitinophagaceae bacterium]|nr:amidohydrolase [Chitinophagaceae bacterium]
MPVATDKKKSYYSTGDFGRVKKWDAHMHINTFDTAFPEYAGKNNFGLLSINVDVPDFPSIEEQRAYAIGQQKTHHNALRYITSFRISGIEDADWLENTIAYLDESFAKGAIGVKVWKNIGMEFKDNNGEFVMIDDPRLDPVFNYLEKNNKTLTGHLGEPKNCWLPLDKMTVKNDREYFEQHPEYHMYLHPESPSYEQQIRARDHMLEKHPGLRFVGAHLGSLEWSIDELAIRLDRFPNMAVDLAERISHLQYQTISDHQKVRDFFIQYQDRVLYGTDIIIDNTQGDNFISGAAQKIWMNHWQYFTSDEIMEAPELDRSFRSLHLPREVVDKIYMNNAQKWYPGSGNNSNG